MRTRLAVKSAKTLVNKAKKAAPNGTSEAMLAAVGKMGLGPKRASYVRAAAEFFQTRGGDFTAEKMKGVSDFDLWCSDMQTDIKGVGPCTTQVVLLKAFARLDVFPAEDSLIQEFLEKKSTDSAGQAAIYNAWKPYRGVAALLIWESQGAH